MIQQLRSKEYIVSINPFNTVDILRKSKMQGLYNNFKSLTDNTATIDHIIPKSKGGHNVKSNMLCSCSSCNRSKGSVLLEEWYNPSNFHYTEERLGKIKHWIEDNSLSIKVLSPDKATPYITNDFYIGWVTS